MTMRQVHGLHQEEGNRYDVFLGDCKDKSAGKTWNVEVTVNSNKIQFKVDSGADSDVTVINMETYKKMMKKPALEKVTRRLRLSTASGYLEVAGQCQAELQYQTGVVRVPVYVTTSTNRKLTCNLRDREAAVKLNLIKFMGSVEENEDIFGFGLWQTESVNLTMQNDVKPYAIAAARTVNCTHSTEETSAEDTEQHGHAGCHHQGHRTNRVVRPHGASGKAKKVPRRANSRQNMC